MLSEQQLTVVERIASQGGRGPSFAKALSISLSTWKVLKGERQVEQIREALERGESLLHDALVVRELKIAMQSDDPREARAATEFLLCTRFNYRPKGDGVNVGISLPDAGPELKLVFETLPLDPTRITNGGETTSDQPQDRQIPVAPRNSLPQKESDPFRDPRFDLADKW
jgi:hypothetical protein